MRSLVIIFLFLSLNSQAQLLNGAAKDEGRKVISETPFVQEGSIDGWAIYELAINREGKVTSAKIIETNLKRTTAKMQLRNYVMTMKFTSGTHFPQFHHAQVKVTMVKGKPAPEIEIPLGD